ncbi:MAG: hypothetical protein JSS86_01305 [Cyanobacteria bacterium SZAS LIN-2]|nr:hypothetical protein [Cyanobacteria bacterium SZAS LIN-3]MBS1994909.1 hypothetical protein [Cyanobacteria bacterium SZAS LIN-2]
MPDLNTKIAALCLACCLQAASPIVASGQQANMQNLEQMLDKVETLKPSGPGPGAAQMMPVQNGGWQQGRPVQQMMQQQGMPQQAMMRPNMPMQALRQQMVPAPQMTEPNSGFGNMFKTFFGDSGSSSQGDASGNAYRAQNDASYARNACRKSYYGDYYTRSQAADEAEYYASQARYEARTAYSKTQYGDPNAESYASSAQSYADAASADASTARDNANRAYR